MYYFCLFRSIAGEPALEVIILALYHHLYSSKYILARGPRYVSESCGQVDHQMELFMATTKADIGLIDSHY